MAADLVPTPEGRVRVKRDGPRGWHWILAAHFDPDKHELCDPPAPTPEPMPVMVKRAAGRPRKHTE